MLSRILSRWGFDDFIPIDDVYERLFEMEEKYDGQFQAIFDVIRQMVAEDIKPKRKIGFHPS